MSFAFTPLKKVRTQDPRTRLNDERLIAVKKGGAVDTWIPQVSTNYSSTSSNWSVVPPSNKVIIDRHVRMLTPFTMTFAGTGNPLLGTSNGYDAMRAFPTSNIITNITFGLNNTQFNYQMSESATALLQYQTDQNDNQTYYSMEPTMKDQSQLYSQLSLSSKNPLNSYADSNLWVEARGSFTDTLTVTNGDGTATVSGIITSDIYLSPFLFQAQEEVGWIGITNFDLQVNYVSNLANRLWSHSDDPNANVLTSAVATISGSQAPTLLMNFITPQIDIPLPPNIVYNWSQVINYTTPCGAGAISGNSQFTQMSNNIQLSVIPKLIYIFARRQTSDYLAPVTSMSQGGIVYTDTFADITNVNITFDNRSGIMAAATPQDLYGIALKNGYKNSWVQKSEHTGFVMCIDPVEDMGLSPLQAPGLIGQTFNFQAQVQFFNLNPNPVTYTMYIVTVTDSVVTVSNGSAVQQIGVLSQTDILDASNYPEVGKIKIDSIYGGSFLSDVGNFFGSVGKSIYSGVKSAAPYLKQGFEIAKEAAPYVKGAVDLAKTFGAGEGGVIVGGRRVPRRKLQQNLLGYY